MKLDKVITYSGYRADEMPLSFVMGNNKLKVNRIIDRWRDMDCYYFKIEGSDGAIYILRHNFEEDYWELTFYNATSNSTP